MSERPPQPPNQEGGANSYGTDDPDKQAQIEAARTAAAEERRTIREKLERYVALGLGEEDATAVIEHEDMLAARRESTEAGDPEEGEAEKRIRPRIYVRSLVDYTEGHDIGDWIDASQDLEAIHADVQAILARSLHTHWTGEPSEEWAIHDYDGFGSVQLHEYESLDIVCALGKGIAEHGQAFAAWAEVNDQRDIYTLGRFETAYFGDYDSREAYAEHVFEEMNGEQELEALPDWVREVVRVDYERMAREMATSGEVQFVEHPRGVWAFNGRA